MPEAPPVIIDRAVFFRTLKVFARKFADDPHHRLRSWDHLHAYWGTADFQRPGELDLTALHLAFYLASYGMYRPSGDLLQRDYKALLPCVELLTGLDSGEWGDSIFDNEPPEFHAARLLGLGGQIKEVLIPCLAHPGHPAEKVKISGTLVSKLLLGTLVCVPAFDREVMRSLDRLIPSYGRGGSGMSKPRMTSTIRLAKDNAALLAEGVTFLAGEIDSQYPRTRVLDLFLWSHGRS